jgi:hypothetical protein
MMEEIIAILLCLAGNKAVFWDRSQLSDNRELAVRMESNVLPQPFGILEHLKLDND